MQLDSDDEYIYKGIPFLDHIATESHFIGINFIQDGFLGSHIDKSKET